jgi:nitrite reductase/ring-hydroxylating ferredoxin subunit
MSAAEFQAVAQVDEIPPGTVKQVVVGEEEIAVANVDGEFYAVHGHCLHLQGPLGEGRLREEVLSCPWHGWQYDVRTGRNVFDLAIELRTYEVRVEDGRIAIAL